MKGKTLLLRLAAELGFLDVRVAKAEFMEEEAIRLENWLGQGNHGSMSYMENHFDKRVDPTKLVPGAKSVVSLAFNYYSEKKQEDSSAPKISQYAFGKDYHFVIKEKLKELLHGLQKELGNIQGRCFVDSAPVLERDWARRNGLGWVGRNTMLINPKMGSYFFLAELIIDYPFEIDEPIADHCGTCTRCVDACPTDAISANGYVMDGSKCISYATIEHRDAIPEEFRGKMENWIFGCDICQEVCPWNRFSVPHTEPTFAPHPDLLGMKKKEWLEITEEVFQEIFRKSAVKRTKFKGLKRNITFINS